MIHGADNDNTGGGRGRALGLRADMDALQLPIREETGPPWASTAPGVMHACGHDEHSAMLLGAARCLAETSNFAGRVYVVFQPAEEIGQGAAAMLQEGRLLKRFPFVHVCRLRMIRTLIEKSGARLTFSTVLAQTL